MSILSCIGGRADDLGVRDARLSPCPSSPNCVSSDARDAEHTVEPFAFRGAPAQAWQAARSAVASLPRTRIVSETPEYLHVECRSLLLRFVDDLELHLRAQEGIIAVRSASRVGYSDLGVNRRRVEAIRAELARQQILRAPE